MALAFLVHVAVSTFAAIALGMAVGRLNALVAIASLTLGAASGLVIWLNFREDRKLFPDIRFVPALLYGFIIYAGLEHFLYLLYYSQHSLKTLHANNFGDLSLHLQYIRYLAAGAHFWPDNPGFAGDLLKYPLGMDIYNSLWEILGVQTDSHLFLTGFAATIASVSMLHRWMGWWGVGAFFLNGGLANWRALTTGTIFDLQDALAWKSFVLSLWITQRGFLFAIPAGVYLIKMVTEALMGERTLRREEKVVCAALWASLAWFHLHTFFILSLVFGILIVLYKKPGLLIELAAPAIAAGLVFFLSTSGLSKTGVLHIRPWWTAAGESFWKFWTINLGPWLIFAAAALYKVFKKEFAPLRPMAVSSFMLFTVFLFVMVAPWDWDNIKVLIWLYLIIAWLAWRTWVMKLSSGVALLIAFAAFFSGTISLISSLPGNSHGTELYRSAEIWDAKAALSSLPSDAVLAVAPEPNHPAMFWGAKVAMGYTGHLWSHGIDSTARENLLERMFRGDSDWSSLAKTAGVTHIYWGPNEQRRYGVFNPPWLKLLRNVSRSQAVQVYDVRSYP